MADYQVIAFSPLGSPLCDLSSFISLEMVRNVNDVGRLVLNIPPDFDNILFTGNDVLPDNRIEVRRRIGAGGFYLEGETQWLTIDGKKSQVQNGKRTSKLILEDAIALLARRIVAYQSGSAQADKAPTFIDNTMKDIVDENFMSAASDTARNINSIYSLLTVQADLGQGASLGKSFSRKNVLDVLKEMANASAQAGTYLAFDVVSPSSSELQFRTYINQRGTDRRFPSSINPVLLSSDLGGLFEASIEYDHSKEVNYAYAGGQGVAASRNIQVSSDATRIALSPFNRREIFVDARQVTAGDANENAKITSEADSAVRSGIVRKTFRATMSETDTNIYGLNVNFGDYVTALFDGQYINCRLNTIRINVLDKKETIEARLQSDV